MCACEQNSQNLIYFVVVTLAAAFGLSTHTITTFNGEKARLDQKQALESNRLEATSWAVFDTSIKFLVRGSVAAVGVVCCSCNVGGYRGVVAVVVVARRCSRTCDTTCMYCCVKRVGLWLRGAVVLPTRVLWRCVSQNKRRVVSQVFIVSCCCCFFAVQVLFFMFGFWLMPAHPSLLNYIVSVGAPAAILYVLGAGLL